MLGVGTHVAVTEVQLGHGAVGRVFVTLLSLILVRLLHSELWSRQVELTHPVADEAHRLSKGISGTDWSHGSGGAVGLDRNLEDHARDVPQSVAPDGGREERRVINGQPLRSEERRVGKECRSGWATGH